MSDLPSAINRMKFMTAELRISNAIDSIAKETGTTNEKWSEEKLFPIILSFAKKAVKGSFVEKLSRFKAEVGEDVWKTISNNAGLNEMIEKWESDTNDKAFFETCDEVTNLINTSSTQNDLISLDDVKLFLYSMTQPQ